MEQHTDERIAVVSLRRYVRGIWFHNEDIPSGHDLGNMLFRFKKRLGNSLISAPTTGAPAMHINSWPADSLGAPDGQLMLPEQCTIDEADGSVSAVTPFTCNGHLRVVGKFVDDSVCGGHRREDGRHQRLMGSGSTRSTLQRWHNDDHFRGSCEQQKHQYAMP